MFLDVDRPDGPPVPREPIDKGPVHVIGATGRAGVALCRSLAMSDVPVVAVVRSLARWRAQGLPGEARVADLTDHFSLSMALGDALRVVSCAHARHTRALMDAGPPDALYVLLGGTSRFARRPDVTALGVLDGERVFVGAGRAGVMLHPSLIYGPKGEIDLHRLATLLRRLPLVPLPGGGRALLQPIHQDDVTTCLLAALNRGWGDGETLVIAGPAPVSWAEFIRTVAMVSRQRVPRIMNMPVSAFTAAASLTGLLPFLPGIGADDIRRLTEDESFDVSPMFARLGVRTRPLLDGLTRTFLTT